MSKVGNVCRDCGTAVGWNSASRCVDCIGMSYSMQRNIDPEIVEEEKISWKITLKGIEVGKIETTDDMLEEIVRKHLVTMHHYNHNISVVKE